jgi:hypothetical protein
LITMLSGGDIALRFVAAATAVRPRYLGDPIAPHKEIEIVF